MAVTDPSDRSKITELAYAYDAIQQDMQDHINQWEKALEALEALETEA